MSICLTLRCSSQCIESSLSARGELEITDAIQDLIDRGLEVLSHQVHGWWKDTGMPEDILEANRIILETLEVPRHGALTDGGRIEGRVRLGEGVTIRNSLIRGPAVIGDGVHLEDAFIGPYTSIGDSCRLVRCEVENSIVMEGCRIEDLPATHGRLSGRPRCACGAIGGQAEGLSVCSRRWLPNRNYVTTLILGAAGMLGPGAVD